jgi:hypothetical protein
MDAVSSVEQMIVMDEHAVQLEAKKQRIRTKKDSMEPKRKQL